MKKFCENCFKDVPCTYHEKNTTIDIEGKNISYLKKYYICSECNCEFLDDLYDYDVMTVNGKLRESYNIITVDQINEILEKYNIGKKPLANILDIGEVNIIRYLNGYNPTREISDLLLSVLNNPVIFELYLTANKDKISKVAYKKSLGKAKQFELSYEHSKIYNVCLYVINKLDEVDPLSLQKILYFANGFSKSFLNKFLFDDVPMAWVHGPVYNDIYDCFSYYKWNDINFEELIKDRDFILSEDEKKYLNEIIVDFGCYSGSMLREMTHLTSPWIDARVNLKIDEPSNRLIDNVDINKYFSDIYRKYKMSDFSDISKYSLELFKNAKKNKFS